MNENEVKTLKPLDRLKDTRDGTLATVIDWNENVLRIRYDDALSSNYIAPADCGHLEMVKQEVR